MAWLTAYAAATSTTASYAAILGAATACETDKPSRGATQTYRDLLARIWVLNPVPGWTTSLAPLAKLKIGPRHQLLDPVLAARLDADVRHLHWLGDRIGGRLVAKVVVTTGEYAYRRDDGVAIIPLGLLS